MQTRLERLILDLQAAARFLRREPLDIAQHHRRSIDLGQLANRRSERITQLRTHHLLIRHRCPVSGFLWRANLLAVRLEQRLDAIPLLRGRTGGAVLAQSRHRRVEGDAVDPRRQRGVAAKRVNLLVHFQQDVLRDFFGVLPVLHVTHRELLDSGAVAHRQLLNRSLVAGLQPSYETSILGPVHGFRSSAIQNTDQFGLIPWTRYSGGFGACPGSAPGLTPKPPATELAVPVRVTAGEEKDAKYLATAWSWWPSSSSSR